MTDSQSDSPGGDHSSAGPSHRGTKRQREVSEEGKEKKSKKR